MNTIDAMTVVGAGIWDAFSEGSEERDAWERLAEALLRKPAQHHVYDGGAYVPPEHDCRTACLPKIGSNEPIFILRAQDKIAPVAVRTWIDIARFAGVPVSKLMGAELIARGMEDWQEYHDGGKLPD